MEPIDSKEVNRALLESVADADVAGVRASIARGADVNTVIPLKNRAFMGARMGTAGSTPLGIAIQERELESTFLHLTEYPNATAHEREDQARRRRAAFLKIIEELVNAGADVHLVATLYQQVSPLCAAAANNDIEALEIFMRRGARLQGTGALHLAAIQGALEAVKVLLGAGLDVNEKFRGLTVIEMLEARKRGTGEPGLELNVGEEMAAEMARREEEREERRELIGEFLRQLQRSAEC